MKKNILLALVISFCLISCRFDTRMAEPPPEPVEEVEPLSKELPHPATRTGWWIRIDTAATECAQIAFDIGTSEESTKFWLGWNKGDPAEFDVAEELLYTHEIFVKATANPQGRAVFCLMRAENGIKHFSFDGDMALLQRDVDRDENCN